MNNNNHIYIQRAILKKEKYKKLPIEKLNTSNSIQYWHNKKKTKELFVNLKVFILF